MKGVIVIDVAAFLHRWRRRLWAWLGRVADASQCVSCGVGLTAEERHYYERSCERCEGIQHWEIS